MCSVIPLPSGYLRCHASKQRCQRHSRLMNHALTVTRIYLAILRESMPAFAKLCKISDTAIQRLGVCLCLRVSKIVNSGQEPLITCPLKRNPRDTLYTSTCQISHCLEHGAQPGAFSAVLCVVAMALSGSEVLGLRKALRNFNETRCRANKSLCDRYVHQQLKHPSKATLGDTVYNRTNMLGEQQLSEERHGTNLPTARG